MLMCVHGFVVCLCVCVSRQQAQALMRDFVVVIVDMILGFSEFMTHVGTRTPTDSKFSVKQHTHVLEIFSTQRILTHKYILYYCGSRSVVC